MGIIFSPPYRWAARPIANLVSCFWGVKIGIRNLRLAAAREQPAQHPLCTCGRSLTCLIHGRQPAQEKPEGTDA